MSSVRDIPGTEQGWAVIDTAVKDAKTRLGDRLVSAYAIGSLAHGGFRPWVSDVDLALLTSDPDDPAIAAAIELIAMSTAALGELGQRLSIFHVPWSRFADPPATSRFPAIDRYDLARYGVLVSGPDLRDQHGQEPSPEQIREQAIESALRRLTPANLAADVKQLAANGITVRDATKLVLWPLRLQHVCDTGTATGNADAVQHYNTLPDARHRELVTQALAWRDQPTLPDPSDALTRIQDEVTDLHAEIFQRVANQRTSPRRTELHDRVAELKP